MRWWPVMKARQMARSALARAHRDDPKVDAVATRALKLRRQNGFAEGIRSAMGVPHDDR